MVALTLNCILGSGIFGLPAAIAQLTGSASPLAVIAAGLGTAAIIACYAELASQFTGSGGTYLYTRHAFGPLIGLQVAWLTLLSRLTACAAAANLFVAYLAEFWPGATEPLSRLAIILTLVSALAIANVRGVRSGTRISDVTGIAKILVLLLVCAAGTLYLARHASVAAAPPHASARDWLSSILLMLFAFGGYETALNPMGEAQRPREDARFALFTALLLLVVVYTLLQWIVIGVLPDPGGSPRPLAATARLLMGEIGGSFVSAAVLVSVFGYLGANLLTVPRTIYGLAEAGDFPRTFAMLHARFNTPFVAIAAFAVLTAGFATLGTFTTNVTLSAVARLFYYAATCLAVPVLRKREPQAALFRVPGGALFPVLGTLFCLVLVTQVDFSEWLALLASAALGFSNWLMVRRNPAAAD